MAQDIVCTGFPLDARNASDEVIANAFIKPFIEEILTYTIFAVLVVVGFIANLLFIFVVYKTKTLHTVMNAYLVNLAVADMIILGYGYLDRLYFYVSTPLNVGTEFLGPLFCTVSTLFEILYYVSLMTVTLFSMERYTAICHPIKHVTISTGGRTRMLLAVTWIFSFILAALQIPGRGRRVAICLLFPEDSKYSHLSGDSHYCTTFFPFYRKAIGVPLQLFPFYVAMFGTAYFYTMIVLRLRSRHGEFAASGDGDQAAVAVNKARIAATRMIIVNGCAFFLCNAPIQFYITITWIFQIVDYEIKIPIAARRNIFLVLTILLYLNSAMNPFIYGVTNSQYRKAFMKILKGRRKGDDRTKDGYNTVTVTTSM